MLVLACAASGYCLEELGNGWQTNDLTMVGEGVFERKGGDPYIIFPEMDEPVCSFSGVHIVLKLSPMIEKPFLAEIFWKPAGGGFSEHNKSFFILHPAKQGDTLNFVVPIEREINYDQIRFDLPRDLPTRFSIKAYEVVDINSTVALEKKIEAYHWLNSKEAEEVDILIPYMIKAIKHGTMRLLHDPAFFVVWIAMIVGILFSLRRVSILLRNMQEKQ